MAETAEPLDAPENSGGAAGDVRPDGMPVGKPFVKGASGNPRGRPKGLARKIREVLGDDDGETLARIAAGIATGYALYIHPETGERIHEKVTVAERQAAIRYLSDRGWGTPPAFAPIDEEDPLGMSIAQEAEIAEEFDRSLDEVAERRRRRDEQRAASDTGPS